MNALTHRTVTLLVLVLVCALPLGSAQAAPASENVATAIIQQDDGEAFDFAWNIHRQTGDDAVLDLNKAQAIAQCSRCEATAIAFQIVLVTGSPATVIPRNLAEAVNDGCTDCTAIAEARQFVRVTPDPVKLTRGGRAVLSDVRRDLAALESQDLPIDQLHQAVETEEARVREVLAEDLVVASDPDTEAEITERKTLQAVDLLD
jgi:putative peptide zinc metalloprotease protein